MGYKRRPAREVARSNGVDSIWIDHAAVVEDDLSWLAGVECLTLWNVTLPDGFLARLPRLWWLDVRGGSAASLASLRGASRVEYLAVNQVRGLSDLSDLPSFSRLRLLDLYGLARVERIPSLGGLRHLRRVQIGQMRALTSLGPILDAPNLRELLLVRKLNVTAADVERISGHASLERFDWFAEDVPDRVSVPVVRQVKLPRAQAMHPGEWFEQHGR